MHVQKLNLSEEERDARRTLAVLSTYLRLRDGRPPSADFAENRRQLDEYNLHFGRAHDANSAIAQNSSPQCQRFIKLYDGVGLQLSQYFNQLLTDPPPDLESVQLLTARLEILQFFERTLFGLILVGAEGGESQLDPQSRATCASRNRVVWTTLLLRSHQSLEKLSEDVLGVKSAMARAEQEAALKNFNTSYGYRQTLLKVGWVIAEIAASIAGWEKVVAPFLNFTVGVVSLTPMGRLITYATGSVYILAWVAIDRYARDVFTFLAPEPNLLNQQTVSRWEEIMRIGEEFLISNLVSPPLYFAYIGLLGVLRKEAAVQFLNENIPLLEQAERDYGSIENATEKLKEVLDNENKTFFNDHRSNGQLAPGPR